MLMENATRHLEAASVKTIKAEVVTEELPTMYISGGIPKELLTDRGSHFMSGTI